jgi:hypothetical protein
LNNITNQFNNINSDSKVEVEKSTVEGIKNSVIEQIDNISKSNDVLKDIIEKKFHLPSDSNITKFINDLDFHNMFSGLNTLEIGAIVHISGSLFILFSLVSIISIIFGDELLLYFNLENKYPKLARFIQIRRKLRYYYLIWNFLLIILVLLTIIYVNLLIFLV